MTIVKVTRNRQITIPADISRIIGIREGDFVEIFVRGEEIVIRKVKSLEELAGSWKDINVEELMNTIRERWRNWSGTA